MLLIAAFVEDDVAVMDEVARQSGDMSKPRPITGSVQSAPDIQDYTADGLSNLNMLLFSVSLFIGVLYQLPFLNLSCVFELGSSDADLTLS